MVKPGVLREGDSIPDGDFWLMNIISLECTYVSILCKRPAICRMVIPHVGNCNLALYGCSVGGDYATRTVAFASTCVKVDFSDVVLVGVHSYSNICGIWGE